MNYHRGENFITSQWLSRGSYIKCYDQHIQTGPRNIIGSEYPQHNRKQRAHYFKTLISLVLISIKKKDDSDLSDFVWRR